MKHELKSSTTLGLSPHYFIKYAFRRNRQISNEGLIKLVSAARSGGVSRSHCRHVMKITTPYELRALIWDYFFKFFRCVCGGGTAQVPKSFIQSVSVSSFLTTLRSTCFWTILVSNAALTCFSPCSLIATENLEKQFSKN